MHALSQLAPLASQHHASEYNRLKFGPQGCPTKYTPLSVHLPDFFSQLQERQIQCTQLDPWSLYPRPPPPTSPVRLGPRGALPDDVSRLENDIRAALASTLDVAPPRNASSELRLLLDPSIKTSSSHPINISPIVPPSLLPVISANLVAPLSPSPTFFRVAPAFVLARLVHPPPSCPPSIQPILTHAPHRQSITDALQAAIHRRFSPRSRHSPIRRSSTLPSAPPSPAAHLDSFSDPLSLSLSIPPLTMTVNRHVSPSNSDDASNSSISLDSSAFPPSPFGNLFLSSCPGKKVRLDGPVKGRSGVCRDLDMDLKRMKALGVGCVICCLDDAELDFLGVPWSKYEQLAGGNGIDILRIPTPEGLAPLTPASLDTHLTKVINTYTLAGIPVLVHCRGGVGRAGVVACCWLIRLGLCGWLKDDVTGDSSTSSSPISPSPVDYDSSEKLPILGPREDTVQFVESVIAVVRRRRSMKAIETYEQVRFLVDFVEYLRKGDAPDLRLSI